MAKYQYKDKLKDKLITLYTCTPGSMAARVGLGKGATPSCQQARKEKDTFNLNHTRLRRKAHITTGQEEG